MREAGQDRNVDLVVDGFWTTVNVGLCTRCYTNLRLADGPTWHWLREFVEKLHIDTE